MHLAAIHRHPVKGLGDQSLSRIELEAGRPAPWDRVWAVAHDRSAFNPLEPEWTASLNFVITTTCPALAQVSGGYDEAEGRLRFRHPALGETDVDPDREPDALARWLAPIAGPSGPGPYRLVRLEPGRALHDFPDTHLSIGNLASLRALETAAGRTLEPRRFRMNLWLDGLAPWEELGWTRCAIGPVRLKITARARRCAATHASPRTGAQDVEVTRLLHALLGHRDFGVYAQVTAGGAVAVGDEVTI